MKQYFEDTIAAISTMSGGGSIGIIRISGIDAITIADKIFVNKKRATGTVARMSTHTVKYGFIIDKESTMIKSLVNAYQEVTKDYESKPICSAGGTYAREFKNCVAFGPEMEGYGEIIIHQPNERIQLRAIEDILKIYVKAFADLIEKVSFE
jgi:succinyl-diaminopimelate desuccinylase